MIPDHIINKAIRALITAEGRDPDDHCEAWRYDAYENDARTILEAVAAELAEYAWDDGYAIGWNDGHNYGDLRSSPDNPYKETA